MFNTYPLLQNRNFLILWGAQTFSGFGNALYGLALPWLVIDMGGSANILGGVFLSTVIPSIAFSLLGGVFADKADRRYILIAVNLARASLMGLFCFFIYAEIIQFYHLYLFGILFGASSAFGDPAFDALLPSLVQRDELQRANALFALGDDVAYTSGPLVAGVLVALIGVGGTILVNAVSFALLVLALFLLNLPKLESVQPQKGTFFKLAAEGFHYVRREKALRALILIFAFGNIGAAILAVSLPFYITDTLGQSSATYGLFLTFMNIGIMLVNLTLARTAIRSVGKVISISFVVMGALGYLLLGQSHLLWLSIVAVMFIEGSSAVGNVLFPSWVQRTVEDRLRGRIFSLISIVSYSLVPVGYSIAGFLIGSLGVEVTLSVTGAVAIALGLVGLVYMPIQSLEM